MNRGWTITQVSKVGLLIALLIFITWLIIVSVSIPNQASSGLLTLVTKTLTASSVPKVNVAEAVTQKKSVLFLDSRERAEFDVSHIKDAIFIGPNPDLTKMKSVDKQKNIIVYCSVGVRSDEATAVLQKAGFSKAKNMFGGIFEWINEGNPVYDTAGRQTDSVHAYSHFWGMFVHNVRKVY